jgi:hypothetical protein
VCNITIAVETESGNYFTTVISPNVAVESVPLPCDIILGCDWFGLCSVGLENNPEAAVHLSPSNQWLIFASAPSDALRSELLPSFSESFLVFDNCLVKSIQMVVLILTTHL